MELRQDHPWFPAFDKMVRMEYFRTKREMEFSDDFDKPRKMPAGVLVRVTDAYEFGPMTYKPMDKRPDCRQVDDCGVRMAIETVTAEGYPTNIPCSYGGAYIDDLDWEPGICDKEVKWPRSYQRHAQSQGWDVFDCDGSEGPRWQLQKLDADPTNRFKNKDPNAWAFVYWNAWTNGCPICIRALQFLYWKSRREYDTVVKHGRKHLTNGK